MKVYVTQSERYTSKTVEVILEKRDINFLLEDPSNSICKVGEGIGVKVRIQEQGESNK